MRLRCPSCSSELDIVAEESAREVKCPSCGSQVDLSGYGDTLTYVPPKLGWLGPFELVEHIGRGHFGDVYRANDSRLQRQVAVKVPRTADFDSSEREAFYREARTAARLRHPGIVTVHEVGSAGDTIFIASELIDGVNLGDLLAGRKFEPRKAAEIAARVADALHHAHEQGVVHRDLKPRNIMLDEQGEPHLLDFGLAKQAAGDFTITAEGDILGTPAYMAPEQARGESGSADRRTDVYSLGVTLYEMLTGKRPFAGEPRGLIYQILHEDPPPPRKLAPTIPRDLETICLKAMAKQPESRYPTAADLAADLRCFLSGEPIHARRAGPIERAWRWCRRNPGISISTGVAASAVAILIVSQLVSVPPGDVSVAVELKVLRREGSLPGSPTSPAETAEVAFWPLDRDTGLPVTEKVVKPPLGSSPVATSLPPGDYLVVAAIPGHGFHEVWRHVPHPHERLPGSYKHQSWEKNPGGLVVLPDIEVPPAEVADGMVLFDRASPLVVGSDELATASKHRRLVRPFLVDPTEVSMAQFTQYFEVPAIVRNAPPSPDHPIRGVNWDIATAFAEKVGKRLIDEFEYEAAATDYGRHQFPWGDDATRMGGWSLGPIETRNFDRTNTTPPVLGLFSGVGEWTSSWAAPYPNEQRLGVVNPSAWHERVIRGAPPSIIESGKLSADERLDPRSRYVLRTPVPKPGLGFRCGRSVQARRAPDDFGAAIEAAP